MFRNCATAPQTDVLPAVNALVRLALPVRLPVGGPAAVESPGGSGSADSSAGDTGPAETPPELPSRIEDIEISWPRAGRRTTLYVAAPRYQGDLEDPGSGTPCGVIWPTPVGLFRLPTRFDGRDRIGPLLRAWRLIVDGPVTRVQRRRYFRVPWIGPVTLELRPHGSPAELQVLAGTTVDLSEGGLRCSLPAPGLADRSAVRVLLPVRDQVLVLPATTVWQRAAPANARLVETGISFDDVEEHGDLLRRVVVEEQLRARRAGLS